MAHPFIPVPGVFKVQLIYAKDGQKIENVFNVKSGAGLASADADRIFAVFVSWWNTNVRPTVASTVSLNLVVFDALDAAASLHKEYTSGWTPAGSSGNAALPNNCTKALKLATTTRGRSYRGRIYWPAMNSTLVVNSVLTSTYRDTLVTAANVLRTSLAADSAADKLVVVSYKNNGVWRTTGVATEVTAITAATLNMDNMRRRLPGRGL